MQTRNFFYYLGPSLIKVVVSVLLLVPITTYYLGPEDFGVVGILIGLTMPLGPLSSLGDNWVLSNHWFKIPNEDRQELVFNLIISNLGFKLVAVVVFWLASFACLEIIIKDYQPEYFYYFSLVLIGFFFNSFWPTITQVMIMEGAARNNAIIEITQLIVNVVVTIVLLSTFKLGVVSIFLAAIATGLCSTIMGLFYIKPKMRAKLRRHWLLEILKHGTPAIPANLIDTISNTVDRYFIQLWHGIASLGIYTHSNTYRNALVLGTKAYSKTIAPLFLETYTKPDKNKDLNFIIDRWYALITLAGIWVILFSKDIVHVLAHGKFDAAAPLVPVWFLLVLTHTFTMPHTQFILHSKKNKNLAGLAILTSLITIALTAIMTYQFNIIGTALSLVVGSLAMVISRAFMARSYGYRYNFDKKIILPFLAFILFYLLSLLTDMTIEAKIAIAILSLAILPLFYLNHPSKRRARWIDNVFTQHGQDRRRDIFLSIAKFCQINRPIDGYYFEFGCHGAHTMRMAYDCFHHLFDWTYVAFDSFEGLPEIAPIDKQEIWEKGKLKTTEDEFVKKVTRHGLPKDKLITIKGFYDQVLNDETKIAA